MPFLFRPWKWNPGPPHAKVYYTHRYNLRVGGWGSFLFLFLKTLFYENVLPTYMYVYHVGVGAQGSQGALELEFQEVVSCSSWVLRTRLRSCGGTVPVDPSLQSRLPRPSSYSSSVISTQVGFLCLLFPFSGNVHWLGLQLSSMSFFSYWIVYPIQK